MADIRQRDDRDDAELLSRCRQGDDRAWAQLLDAYDAYVHTIPLSYGLSADDAADVVQQVFTELIRRLDDIADGLVRGVADMDGQVDGDGLGGWLSTTARRITWRTMARRRARTGVIDLTDPLEDVDPWHEWIDAWTDRRWVAETVTALPSPCRDLLHALYLDPTEPTYAQISERLGRPIGSIGPTRARCLDKLRLVMGQLGDHA